MKNNQRMFFIRNIDDLKDESAESHTTEYEVIADAPIVGEISFGPYYFTIWELDLKSKGEKRKLCLRIKEKLLSSVENWGEAATRQGFYHGGGIAEEIVALSSLGLHRRFILGPIVRDNDLPRIFSSRSGYIDESLIEEKAL